MKKYKLGDTIKLSKNETKLISEHFKGNETRRQEAYMMLESVQENDTKMWNEIHKNHPDIKGLSLSFDNQDKILYVKGDGREKLKL